MTTPIDIVAAAVHAAHCGCPTVEQPAYDTAQAAVGALVDPGVVLNARRALLDEGYSDTDNATLHEIAEVVLRSVGGGA